MFNAVEIDVEQIEDEVDALFDYMDERVELGVDPSDVAAAIIVVMTMLGEPHGEVMH